MNMPKDCSILTLFSVAVVVERELADNWLSNFVCLIKMDGSSSLKPFDYYWKLKFKDEWYFLDTELLRTV